MPVETIHLCQCGCGTEVGVWKENDASNGRVKGEPKRFAVGHKGGRPIEERFWPKVARRGPDECWEWTGADNGIGYGKLYSHSTGGPVFAYRVSYEIAYGPIPHGYEVHHMCENPTCVNPDHLEAVTTAEHAERHRVGVCKYGHELTPDNLVSDGPGGRHRCRKCKQRRGREWYRRKVQRTAT